MDKFDKFLNGCNSMTVKHVWLVGLNEPGYLPDDAPWIFDSFVEAKQCVIDFLKQDEDNAISEDIAENICALAESVNLEQSDFTIPQVSGYTHVYWVTKQTEIEPEFSYSGCECCNDGLGNDVLSVEGYNPESKEIIDLGHVCHECLIAFNYY